MICDVANFEAHFLKYCDHEWEKDYTMIPFFSILWTELARFRKIFWTMIRLSPIMIRIRACTSDFSRLWFVDARSWVETVRPNSLVQTVYLLSGSGYSPDKKFSNHISAKSSRARSCTRSHAHAYTHTDTHKHRHTYMQLQKHTHTYIHTHTQHTHIHIYIYI